MHQKFSESISKRMKLTEAGWAAAIQARIVKKKQRKSWREGRRNESTK